MSCLWHVFCHVCGMFCVLNWEDIVADGKWLFLGWFRVKMMCTRAANELSGRLLCRSNAIAWLGFNTTASGTHLHGFWCNCVAPAHFQTSNFKRPYFSRPNSDSHVLRLYKKLFESTI